jgi:hypothetical protein
MVGFFLMFIASAHLDPRPEFFQPAFSRADGFVRPDWNVVLSAAAACGGHLAQNAADVLAGAENELVRAMVILKVFFIRPDVRQTVELLSLTSLLPVLFLSFRWKSSFGDRSQIGSTLASVMFHLIHAVFLAVCIWVAFDPPFSPATSWFGFPFLTFYYLGALSVGYYGGYFLVVFRPEIGWHVRDGQNGRHSNC